MEENIGVLLPCNVIVQEKENSKVQVSVINPMESMKAVGNEALGEVAQEISKKLISVLDAI